MRIWTLATCCLLGAVLSLTLNGADTDALQLTNQEGERFQRKIDEITKNGSAFPVSPKKTVVSENELNSYLAFNGKDTIPQGLSDPQVTIVGEGRLAGRIFVNLDDFKRQRPSGGFMDPLNYLSGRVPIAARGVLRTREGKGQFEFSSADIRGIPLPKPVIQELVTFFSRTPENPRGFDLDAPFDLPARIRELLINSGQAVVVQ
jgi:hypothetical protein